ncbi:hypothetical protein BU14_0076s0026 [Porphyra umbilicalis]|uniref:Uncharacterized protein n=1 Tax=Porphyra umbilicalis TaxID=2786 RepID=A0A1X6PF53_PORUM|nr:hypothetical protein BU14_0076s0026 [Porphyra umbilicalis]|eukprot:OSX79470.1 hypothetical protein BU14_0076s0026 [Porphyra umbilicalis]
MRRLRVRFSILPLPTSLQITTCQQIVLQVGASEQWVGCATGEGTAGMRSGGRAGVGERDGGGG